MPSHPSAEGVPRVPGAVVGRHAVSNTGASDGASARRTWHARGVPVTIEDVRRVAEQLPRSYEVLVRDRVKFRVGRIVWLAFSADETQMGFAFPREERQVLVASEPDVFLMPRRSDLRFNWVEVRLAALDEARMREIVLDAWRLVVPRTVALAHSADG